jgi:hypothetical protein
VIVVVKVPKLANQSINQSINQSSLLSIPKRRVKGTRTDHSKLAKALVAARHVLQVFKCWSTFTEVPYGQGIKVLSFQGFVGRF